MGVLGMARDTYWRRSHTAFYFCGYQPKATQAKTAYLNFYFYHSLVFSLLSFAALWSLSTVMLLGGIAEIRLMNFNNNGIDSLCWILGLWLLWGCLFYLYYRESSELITRLITWLLRGSVLELLIVVPCHVYARHKGECSASEITAFGVTTGIAIMLLSFGPSVLLLYKKRLDKYTQ